MLRIRLMKKGGIGYVQPSPDSFPTVEEFHRLIVACGALPCATWLDGTSAGEQAIGELLELLIGLGVAALNIIPDRNWNIADPELRHVKIKNLHEIVKTAGDLDLPLNVGTEMNSPGNRLVDDFSVAGHGPAAGGHSWRALYFIYGHTVLQGARRLGYQSEWAQTHLPARNVRNVFFETVGRRATPGEARLGRLSDLPAATTPQAVLDALAHDR